MMKPVRLKARKSSPAQMRNFSSSGKAKYSVLFNAYREINMKTVQLYQINDLVCSGHLQRK